MFINKPQYNTTAATATKRKNGNNLNFNLHPTVLWWMWWRWFWLCLKMIYKLFCCSVSLIFFCFNVLWFFCNLAIPWCTLTLLIICVASKFVKLQRSPNEKRLLSLLNTPDDWPNYWPIANRGAGYDAPENSKAAVKKVGACAFVWRQPS